MSNSLFITLLQRSMTSIRSQDYTTSRFNYHSVSEHWFPPSPPASPPPRPPLLAPRIDTNQCSYIIISSVFSSLLLFTLFLLFPRSFHLDITKIQPFSSASVLVDRIAKISQKYSRRLLVAFYIVFHHAVGHLQCVCGTSTVILWMIFGYVG